MFIKQSQTQILPFQFSIFYDYSIEQGKKEKKHATFCSRLSNSSVINVDVRMVIMTEDERYGPFTIALAGSESDSATFPVGDYSLPLLPSPKRLDTAKKISRAPSPETCLTKCSPTTVFRFNSQWFCLQSGQPGCSLGKG